ncbi:MAG TPA: LPS export ABC transporter periplasmic protein LptC [Dongiaceae bacterium]|nr:LPS export ABC transporter periplasmic protein LptC [Dongiaceae bacterium]
MIPNAASNLGARRRIVRPTGRLVRVLTLALPMISVTAASGLIYGWAQPGWRVVPVEGPTTADAVTSGVKFDGRDHRGRLFSITADTASPIEGDDRHVSLTKPLADITMSGGAYVALAANESILSRDAGLMSLSGDVTLFHDTGLSFQTDSAIIDIMAGTAEGNDVVEGQNGDGELVSQGFRVLDDGDTIEFTGKTYMKIYPKRKNQEGQGG